MNDTPPEIEEMVRERFMKKPPLERFKMGCEMYDTSKYLIKWAILNNNPGISKLELWKQLFLSFYGEEFSSEEKEKIFAHIENRIKNGLEINP